MIVREINAKSILSKSKVFDYTINPYIGCAHGCTYCYARFVKRFTGHKEKWGEFVDVKINSEDLLQREIRYKRIGRVWISGLCDPFQPLEKKYEITRRCLEILAEFCWPITIQTKSPLVLRDIDLLKKFQDVEVVLTITTANEKIREIFEPNSPTIEERIKALRVLRSAGIKTSVMIAPILPGTEDLIERIAGEVSNVLIDKLNYHYADFVYKRYGLEFAMKSEFFNEMKRKLASAFRERGVMYELLF